MQVELRQANILDVEADILVCSANVSLNLTGGVGADLMARYGTAMQEDLHRQLALSAQNFAMQGDVFVCQLPELPYQAVLHAVAVDPLYHSSAQVITDICDEVLGIAQEYRAETIALTALATGFGDLSLAQFVEGLTPCLIKSYPPVEKLIVCQIDDYRFTELREAFGVG